MTGEERIKLAEEIKEKLDKLYQSEGNNNNDINYYDLGNAEHHIDTYIAEKKETLLVCPHCGKHI